MAKLFGLDLPAFGEAKSQEIPERKGLEPGNPFEAAIARAKPDDVVMRNPMVKKKPPRKPSWSLR